MNNLVYEILEEEDVAFYNSLDDVAFALRLGHGNIVAFHSIFFAQHGLELKYDHDGQVNQYRLCRYVGDKCIEYPVPDIIVVMKDGSIALHDSKFKNSLDNKDGGWYVRLDTFRISRRSDSDILSDPRNDGGYVELAMLCGYDMVFIGFGRPSGDVKHVLVYNKQDPQYVPEVISDVIPPYGNRKYHNGNPHNKFSLFNAGMFHDKTYNSELIAEAAKQP